jgi:shikimate kinase
MNIVCIGFKSSGKSTVGRILAKIAGMDFVDTDDWLETLFYEQNSVYLSCRDIYRKFGASFMRGLETKALQSLSELKNCVIATGGGVVLQEQNTALLRRAGLCVFLDVPAQVLEKRLVGSVSPLFKEKSVAQVYQERYPLYLAAAELSFAVHESAGPEEVAQSLHSRILDYLKQG